MVKMRNFSFLPYALFIYNLNVSSGFKQQSILLRVLSKFLKPLALKINLLKTRFFDSIQLLLMRLPLINVNELMISSCQFVSILQNSSYSSMPHDSKYSIASSMTLGASSSVVSALSLIQYSFSSYAALSSSKALKTISRISLRLTYLFNRLLYLGSLSIFLLWSNMLRNFINRYFYDRLFLSQVSI